MKEFYFKKKYIIILISILSTLLIGTTYALLTVNLLGKKTNSIIVGNLELVLDETQCNGISVEKGIPIPDEEGMQQVACTFSVENTGNLDSNYTILVEDVALEDYERRVSDSDIRYSLIKNSAPARIDFLSNLNVNSVRVLESSVLESGEKDVYELRFWVKYDASADSMNKTFLTKLKLVGESYNIVDGVIPNINDYYIYGTSSEIDVFGDGSYIIPGRVNSVSLTNDFNNALKNNVSFTDSLGLVWNPGDPLPNPGAVYYNDEGVFPVESMSILFSGLENVMLDLSLWDTSNVKYMDGMFIGNNNLEVNLKNLNTSSVLNMSSMFLFNSFKELNLNNFDTSKVVDMSYMFYRMDTDIIDISSFDTSNVTNMSEMFADSYLPILDFSNFDTSKVTDMSGMFFEANTSSIDVSNFNTSNVTNMSGMFNGCLAASIDLTGLNTSNVTNMSAMFDSSYAPKLDLSGFDTSKVTDMSGMFFGSDVIDLNISNFDTSNVTDMSNMFRATSITNLDLSHFNTKNVTDMEMMFHSANILTLNINNFDTSNVTNMRMLFAYSDMTSLDVSSFDIGNVTSMWRMFYYSNANPIYVKDQTSLEIFDSDGYATFDRLVIK